MCTSYSYVYLMFICVPHACSMFVCVPHVRMCTSCSYVYLMHAALTSTHAVAFKLCHSYADVCLYNIFPKQAVTKYAIILSMVKICVRCMPGFLTVHMNWWQSGLKVCFYLGCPISIRSFHIWLTSWVNSIMNSSGALSHSAGRVMLKLLLRKYGPPNNREVSWNTRGGWKK